MKASIMRPVCPACSKRHVRFPRQCYYAVHSNHVFSVIAKLASLGNPIQQKFAADSSVTWHAMREYVLAAFPGEPALKDVDGLQADPTAQTQ